jgi:hypothetical protein
VNDNKREVKRSKDSEDEFLNFKSNETNEELEDSNKKRKILSVEEPTVGLR